MNRVESTMAHVRLVAPWPVSQLVVLRLAKGRLLMNLLKFTSVGALFFATALATAATVQFTQTYGTGASVSSVASLDYYQINERYGWSFGIFAKSISPMSFLNAIALDIDGPPLDYGTGLTNRRVEGGINSVTLLNGGGPDASFDFVIKLGGGADTLTRGEGAIFSFVDMTYKSLNRFAVEVTEGSQSTWYTATAVSAVPEPAVSALLFAGLLMLLTAGRSGLPSALLRAPVGWRVGNRIPLFSR